MAECVIQIIGTRQIVSAASLQVFQLSSSPCAPFSRVLPSLCYIALDKAQHGCRRCAPGSELIYRLHCGWQETAGGAGIRPLTTNVRQPESSEPSIARIACIPGSDGVQPSIVGGQGLAGLSANFTGGVQRLAEMPKAHQGRQ